MQAFFCIFVGLRGGCVPARVALKNRTAKARLPHGTARQ